jgi:hypothetical protein
MRGRAWPASLREKPTPARALAQLQRAKRVRAEPDPESVFVELEPSVDPPPPGGTPALSLARGTPILGPHLRRV